MTVEETSVDPSVELRSALDPIGAGADGASYRAIETGRGPRELWRLRPSSLSEDRRRRLDVVRLLDHAALLPIDEVELDVPAPQVWLRGEIAWGREARWPTDPEELRTQLCALFDALAAAHRFDVVHGHLGLGHVGSAEDGRLVLDLTGLRVRPPIEAAEAPEIRGGVPSAAADVWALATVAVSRAPFEHISGPAAEGLRRAVGDMRHEEPERRPTANSARSLLSDAGSGITTADLAQGSGAKPPGAKADIHGVPKQLGGYRLLEKVGSGGMGHVYRAEDLGGGPDVAIKVLISAWADNETVLERFRREARILAQLQSEHIARFIAANEDDGVHYLVMELVNAESAQSLLKSRGKLDPDLAIGIACDVARAVGEVHGLGLVHRDVKPANVLVALDGETPVVKLCDFGIARTTAPMEVDLTQGGAPGTPSYMAPEMVGGGHIGPGVDVYAIGATLYCLIAGRPPFVGAAPQVMMAHLHEEAEPLIELEPSIPRAVSELVMRCLAKPPEDRFPDASSLHDALQRAWRGELLSPADVLPQPLGLEGSPQIYNFVWELSADREALWPHVSNTERINRAAGLDDVEWSHSPGDGYVQTEGRFRAAGMELRWKENPFEWVAPKRLGVVREYVAGPFQWLRSIVELSPGANGGTQLRHRVEILPRGIIGRIAASVEVGLRLRRGLDRVYRRIDTVCSVEQERAGVAADPFEKPVRASSDLRDRIDEGISRALAGGADLHVSEGLGNFLLGAPTPELGRIRPRVWARERGYSDELVLKTFLLAAHEGLLTLLWDILCPSCRIPSGIEESLRALETHGRCEVCDLDFELDMARSVELVFRAHPSIREADAGVYCIGGPAHSPHVLAQVRLAPAQTLVLDLELPPGRYCLAGRGLLRQWSFRVAAGAHLSRWDLALRSGPSANVERNLKAGAQQLVMTNDLEHELLVRLEHSAKRDDAVTAADAAASAVFRLLFPEQVLSPDRLVAISDVALLFANVSDALDRFDADEADVHRELLALAERLDRAAGEEGGTLVKLVGDGVVAVFNDRASALRTASRIQRTGVGVALHAGPARMTTIGGRLDYFGKTLHIGEHMGRWAESGEMLVSESVASDPELMSLLDPSLQLFGHYQRGGLIVTRFRRADDGSERPGPPG